MSYYLEKSINGKEVVIDWFQVTFDFIPVRYIKDLNRYILDKSDIRFEQLIRILNPKTDLIKKDYDTYIEEMIETLTTKKSGRFRFDNGYMLGEHIELSFGGNKTRLDTYPVVLILSGQGCREFEKAGGNWIELFKFILANGSAGHLKIGRLDIAIDDFDGFEITPYQIEPHIRKHNYLSPFRKVNFNITEIHSKNPETDGFSITFGSRGSNQLQIYDKNLERRANKQVDKNTDKWFRYEMRFLDEMAYTILTRYIEAYDLNNSIDFMDYVQGVLRSLLDIKEVDPNNSNKSRWKTLPEWDNFLNSLSKVDITRISQTETTIEKKIDWFKDDMANTLLEFALIYEGDNFMEYINEVISSADFKTKHLTRVNNYFNNKNMPNIDMNEVEQIQSKFNRKKEIFNVDEKMSKWDLLRKTFSGFHIEDFEYIDIEEEKNIFTLYGEIYEIEFSNDISGFSNVTNKFYLNEKDLNYKYKILNIIKSRMRMMKR